MKYCKPFPGLAACPAISNVPLLEPKLIASTLQVKEVDVVDMQARLAYNDVYLDSSLNDEGVDTMMDFLATDEDVEDIVSEKDMQDVLKERVTAFKTP